jgi:LacI family transcriptional regulator
MTPPLTTVRQPTYEIGRLAAQGIVQMIRKQPITLNPIPLTLVTRETTQRIGPAPSPTPSSKRAKARR